MVLKFTLRELIAIFCKSQKIHGKKSYAAQDVWVSWVASIFGTL